MQTEREREAKELEHKEQNCTKIRSTADKDVTVILLKQIKVEIKKEEMVIETKYC